MENQIFRKKSMERLSSPEQLNDYLRVTTPSVWIVLAAVILMLISIFVWSFFTSVKSYFTGNGSVEDGIMTVTFTEAGAAAAIEEGMEVIVGEMSGKIMSVGKDDFGHIVAAVRMPLPDGNYDARVSYRQTQIISLLFN